ncbi:MAG: hypothetical protein HOP02_12820 [Methylococcaceae bacterium]|nr:hypothetical protein [Methylococcaceae bacterium]
MRNLTKTLVAVSLLTSTSVHSLGIGGIKLRSALNQKLNAEIALVTSGGESVGDIKVKLASPAKFDEAGVPWSYFLSKIKFTPVAKDDGSVVVKLTSDEALKEPYLDFLLEVTGASGDLFREFTVLVDPPATYNQPAIQVAPSVAADRGLANNFPAPVNQAESVLQESNAIGMPDAIDGGYSAISEYGPVRKGDTIRNIANRIKPDDVSNAQMVMAIYQANPHAFSIPNVNALMAGKMLAVPERDVALKLTQRQASAAVRRQRVLWHKGVNDASANDKPKPAVIESKSAPVQPKPADSEVATTLEPTKQLKLNPPPEEAMAALAGKDNNKVPAEENTASTDAASTDVALEDAGLKQRFDKMEQQLLMMQKMLELKDAQLATLQNQNKPLPVNVEKVPSVAEPLAPQPIAEAVSVNPLAPQSAVETKPVSEVVVKPLATATPVVKAAPVIQKTVVTDVLANPFADYYWLAGGLGGSLLAGALGWMWWRKRKVEQAVDTESMFASASQISLPDVEKEVEVPTNNATGYDVAVVGDSAFLSEFTPSEFDAFETDQTEIDPLSEADVYLAYGRYQQAEELIRQVIVEHPSRDECKLKLLEIFHTSENKQQFDQYAQQLMQEGKQADKAFWAKVVEMSNEFTSGSGLLMGLGEEGASTSDVSMKIAERPLLIDTEFKPATDDFDLDTFSSDDSAKVITAVNSTAVFSEQDHDLALDESEFAVTEDVSTYKGELDFDLDAFATESFSLQDETATVIHEEATDNDFSDLDFDLEAFDSKVNTVAIQNPDKGKVDFSVSEIDGLESFGESIKNSTLQDDDLSAAFANLEKETPDSFDFVLDRGEHKTAGDFKVNNDEDAAYHDFDFSDANINLKTAPAVDDKNLDSDDIESFDFNFDFNPSVDATKKFDKLLDPAEVSDLTDSDNVFETKVNLANAYVDMGDVAAAKVIANDLLKGTAEQKKAGQEILEKIS